MTRSPLLTRPGRRGQALTEFLVLAAALVPLFLLLPLIAKYQDVAGQVQMASRYVTFEAMTRNDAQSSWKTPAELAGDVRRRFFGNADAPIKTGDVAGNFMAHQNLFWRRPDGTPLIADFDSDVAVSFGPDHQPDHDHGFTSAADGEPFDGVASAAVGIDTADKLGLASRGIYTGNVVVRLAKLPAELKAYQPFDSINLDIGRHTSVAIDGWSARSAAQTQSRIDSGVLVPATKLRAIAAVVNGSISLVEVGQIHGPKLGELDFWQDTVPEDRLK